jgi:hypothetical protein
MMLALLFLFFSIHLVSFSAFETIHFDADRGGVGRAPVHEQVVQEGAYVKKDRLVVEEELGEEREVLAEELVF